MPSANFRYFVEFPFKESSHIWGGGMKQLELLREKRSKLFVIGGFCGKLKASISLFKGMLSALPSRPSAETIPSSIGRTSCFLWFLGTIG